MGNFPRSSYVPLLARDDVAPAFDGPADKEKKA